MVGPFPVPQSIFLHLEMRETGPEKLNKLPNIRGALSTSQGHLLLATLSTAAHWVIRALAFWQDHLHCDGTLPQDHGTFNIPVPSSLSTTPKSSQENRNVSMSGQMATSLGGEVTFWWCKYHNPVFVVFLQSLGSHYHRDSSHLHPWTTPNPKEF